VLSKPTFYLWSSEKSLWKWMERLVLALMQLLAARSVGWNDIFEATHSTTLRKDCCNNKNGGRPSQPPVEFAAA
jgi:hypothetical protein